MGRQGPVPSSCHRLGLWEECLQNLQRQVVSERDPYSLSCSSWTRKCLGFLAAWSAGFTPASLPSLGSR